MPTSIYTVDAFTSRPFEGNPAGVCILLGPADEGWMQSIAAETNLSETAFVHPMAEGFSLRWFTPSQEVDLCGHATLATAHALWEGGMLAEDEDAVFHTKSGVLTASRAGEWIEMDFPAYPIQAVDAPEGLEEALGVEPRFVGASSDGYLVIAEADSEETVRGLTPDIRALAGIPINDVCVTAQSECGAYDFVSRFFAPRLGVDEDPVTGSAHCGLGPFWADRLGKNELVGYQASARGGIVRVRVMGDRVILGGQAVTVIRGLIL